jgi:alpha-beta hydrolase superfamily lysophospholipase
MIRKLLAVSLLFVSCVMVNAQMKHEYVPDSLCQGFQKTTLDMGNDYNGRVVATLVRKMAPDTNTRKAVLYIHGFNDYFFQTEMADQYIKHGYNFYAVDLRKNGRSILPGQVKGDVRNLIEYYNEIEESLNVIRSEKNTFVVLSGHSMGGLVAALYAEDRIGKEKFDAVFLNSPFFAWNMSPILRATLLQIAAKEGASRPEGTRKSPGLGFYGESLHKNFRGEWDYSLALKPLMAPDITYGWIHAVNDGIKRVQSGLHIAKPVLVMHSDRSINPKKWTDDLFNADAVLDVEDIHKYARTISTNVKIIGITGGMHDLVLSRKPVRDEVYSLLFDYLAPLEPKK